MKTARRDKIMNTTKANPRAMAGIRLCHSSRITLLNMGRWEKGFRRFQIRFGSGQGWTVAVTGAAAGFSENRLK